MIGDTYTNPEIQRHKSQAVGGMRKRCRKGKNCSAACIQASMTCIVNLPESVQSSIPKAIQEIESKVNQELNSTALNFRSYKSEKEVIDYLDKYHKSLLTEGMERGYYGAPGQRGTPKSQIWFLGQPALRSLSPKDHSNSGTTPPSRSG